MSGILMNYMATAKTAVAINNNDNGDPSDPSYSLTYALLNFQGANGSTTWTNEAANLSWGEYTSVGTPQISTAQFVYGSSSMRVNGGANRIQLDSQQTSGFASSWTLEGWFRSDEESYTGGTTSLRGVKLVTNSGGMDRACNLGFYSEGQSLAYRALYGSNDGGGLAINNNSYNIAANTWYYYCLSSSLPTKTVTLYMAPFGSTGVDTVESYTPSNGNMMALLFQSIGGNVSGGGLAGYIGPTRLTIGVARTPTIPTGLFPNN